MRHAHAFALVLGIGAAARADEPLYDQTYRVRVLTGVGADYHNTFFASFNAELGQSPFRGALSTGGGVASATALDGKWTVVTPYIFGRLDVVHVILSHFWSRKPDPTFPLRAHGGLRFGLDVSESFRTAIPSVETSYVLVRPAAQGFIDVEYAVDGAHQLAVALRVGTEVPLSLDAIFRTTASLGLVYCWGGGEQ